MIVMMASPRRYIAAAVTGAVGLLAAGLLWWGLPIGGDLGERFDAGQPITVNLEGGRPYMVWAGGETEPRCDVVRVEDAPNSSVEIRREPDQTVFLDAAGQTWRGTVLVRANPAGAFRLTCDTSGGLGDPPWGYGPKAQAITAVAALSLATAGILTGIVIALRRTAGTSKRRPRAWEGRGAANDNRSPGGVNGIERRCGPWTERPTLTRMASSPRTTEGRLQRPRRHRAQPLGPAPRRRGTSRGDPRRRGVRRRRLGTENSSRSARRRSGLGAAGTTLHRQRGL